MDRFTIKDTNIFFVLFLILYVVISITAGYFLPADIPAWMSMCISDIIIISPVIIFFGFRKVNPFRFLMSSSVGIMDVVLAYAAAYMLLPVIYCINYVTMFFARNYVNGMVSEIYEYPFAVQIILIALLPAMAEEFIFRGILYGSYRRRNVVKAALMSGLLFGITHLNLNQFAYAFAMGAAFCVLYEAAGNIVVPMTAHFAVNANTILILHLSQIDAGQLTDSMASEVTAEIPPDALLAGIVFLCVLGIAGLVFFCLIVRKLAKRNNRMECLSQSMQNHRIYSEEPEGKFIDIYMLAAVFLAMVYMIMLEI